MASIIDILEEHGVQIAPEGHHHGRSGWVNMDCVRCGAGSSAYHLGFQVSYGYFNCWRCGKLPLVSTLADLTGLPEHTCRRLVRTLDRQPAEQKEEYEKQGKLELPAGLIDGLLPAHKTYLRSRGFDPKIITKLWGVRGIGRMSKDYAWRLWIPVHRHTEVLSWTTRSISPDAKLRYKSAKACMEKVSIKKLLYGLDYVRHAVIVHEGSTDAWKVGPGAVATMGIGYTRTQVRLLSKIPIRAICFDNEPDAQRRAIELCNLLTPFEGRTMNIVLDAKDAASAPDREIVLLRKTVLEAG